MKLLNPATLYDSTPNAYSQIAVVPPGRRLVFISGQGGDNPDGSFPADFQAQAESAFRNIGLALGAAGAHPRDVAKLTILIVGYDMEKLRIMQAAQRALFGTHFPAGTLIPVPCLALPDMQIEVEAIAAVAE
jgi:enamine deaminase RidA (YjgF/YER057c/UK114 family)